MIWIAVVIFLACVIIGYTLLKQSDREANTINMASSSNHSTEIAQARTSITKSEKKSNRKSTKRNDMEPYIILTMFIVATLFILTALYLDDKKKAATSGD